MRNTTEAKGLFYTSPGPAPWEKKPALRLQANGLPYRTIYKAGRWPATIHLHRVSHGVAVGWYEGRLWRRRL
ncbi:MAG TPA: hypothetical protein VG146_01870 [Verrucomicrobiae bacterium]|nr:hypothetical protein [Verrucomicrobiae bacterium]